MTVSVRDFGTTGYQISTIGFGAWAAGGADWAYSFGQQDDKDSIAAIHRAIEHGVNWVDTAPVYGYGHSEDVVRRALADIPKPKRPYIFTKCGLEWNPLDRNARSQRIGDPLVLRKSVEASLKRLDVEALDLLLMHWPASDGTPLEVYWQTLLDLKSEGKARAVGLSNHSAEQLETCRKLGHVDALQNPFSALKRETAEHDLGWCVQHDTGVIVYSPLQSGLLGGSFTRERAEALAADDWRSRAPLFKGEELETSLAVASVLTEIGKERGVTAGAVAIAWTLAWRGVTGAIVGARNARQIDGIIAGASLELDAAELERIAAIIRGTGAGSGPTLPV